MNIICDLDGTLADDTHRTHHLHVDGCQKKTDPFAVFCTCTPEQRDWKSYFAASGKDGLHSHIAQLLDVLYDHHKIYILSGRSMSTHKDTLKWLEKHAIWHHYLQMRNVDDRTADDKLKLRWACDLNLTPENTLFVLEDRTRVVNAWRAAGFKCLQVAPGDF